MFVSTGTEAESKWLPRSTEHVHVPPTLDSYDTDGLPRLGNADTHLLVVHPQHIIKVVFFCIIFNQKIHLEKPKDRIIAAGGPMCTHHAHSRPGEMRTLSRKPTAAPEAKDGQRGRKAGTKLSGISDLYKTRRNSPQTSYPQARQQRHTQG